MKWSIGKKIGIVVISLILILSSGMGFLSIYLGSNALTEAIENGMLSYSKEASNHISTILSSNLRVLSELAARDRVVGMDLSVQKKR